MQNLIHGVVVGRVVNNEDPEAQARVEVEFTSLGDGSPTRWCSVASVAAGGDRGVFFMPEIGDEVLVAFDHGDFDHGFIIGYPWNPVQMPPSAHAGERMIRSREGHTIRFVDSHENGGNYGALIIEDAHGNVITMTNGVMTISAVGVLNIDAPLVNIMGRPVNPLGGAI
ncbi:hypothetical protein E4634_01115 [Mangrovimicrobium sediminis]|uniref:Gp5/Type VI secretion system Vgr protein OB-fold domain-containing protein n=1 Tax=Mangrovimicrobium sediminis TaxID=2562682 RepID=A0A4Z0M9W2_9GAMM|nr:phage baseplate assembly protein V [Haliea sp. SAOS-164]TGD76178.1 hypothetical protein E4634_01115 [Haliea sp. SAOS-164]